MVQVDDVILSTDCFTECFCCDLAACRGACCIEGEAGAPVTPEEVMHLEDVLDTVRPDLSPEARAVIDRQGVAYTDADGDLVTSIVGGKDCVFTCRDAAGCCLCATERAWRDGRTAWSKPGASPSRAPSTPSASCTSRTASPGSTITAGTSAPPPCAKAGSWACPSTASCASPSPTASAPHGTPASKKPPKPSAKKALSTKHLRLSASFYPRNGINPWNFLIFTPEMV